MSDHEDHERGPPKKRSGGGGGPSNIKRESGRGGGGERERERGFDGPIDDQSTELYRELIREKEDLDPKEFPAVHRLIDKELSRLCRRGGSDYFHQHEAVDLFNDPPVTLAIKCYPPTKEFPNFNYAGRIIGPKGAYLKAVMKHTSTKMVLLGSGVMKDKDKEEELKKSSDPKYFHLRDDMHVAVTATGPASEAYYKASHAIESLKRQVVSDNKELLSLPWIVRVLESGEGPPQAYQQLENSRRYGSPPPYARGRGSSSSHNYYADGHPPQRYSSSSRGRHHGYTPPPPSHIRPPRMKESGSGRGYYDEPSSPKRSRHSGPNNYYTRSSSRSTPPPASYDYDSGDSYSSDRTGMKRSGGVPVSSRYAPHRK